MPLTSDIFGVRQGIMSIDKHHEAKQDGFAMLRTGGAGGSGGTLGILQSSAGEQLGLRPGGPEKSSTDEQKARRHEHVWHKRHGPTVGHLTQAKGCPGVPPSRAGGCYACLGSYMYCSAPLAWHVGGQLQL